MALKIKLRHTCVKYGQIKVPYRHRRVKNNLRRNKDLVISEPDKGKGVVLLDRTVYIANVYQFLIASISNS